MPATHCGTRVIDAVDLPDAALIDSMSIALDTGNATVSDTGVVPQSDSATTVTPDASTRPTLIWPNATSSANSDPWLVAHHDSMTQMRPRVLVFDYYNPWSARQARVLAQGRIDALAESTRYHGYMNPTAPAFLTYALVGVVDLTDHPPPPPGAQREASSRLPTDANGAYDMGLLFAQTLVADAANPSQLLTLCQLFERGFINELWLMTGDEGTPRRPPQLVESKQAYDSKNAPIAGVFDRRTGYEPWPVSVPHCHVTARVAYLSPINDVGCDLVSHSAGLENTYHAIPYLAVNASHFFNQDFGARFGTSFNGWADLWCASSAGCITYPRQNVAQGTYMDGGSWKMDPFIQGCGTAHFPPNARSEWDYANPQPVESRCEHYAMHDGPGGGDRPDVYSLSKEAALALPSGDGCAGGWQVYLRQSVPGLSNTAYSADGISPMKNWWPFLFY